MFGEEKIHDELYKYSQKDELNDMQAWNILTRRKFRQEDELSQWNTSSHPTMPKNKKNNLSFHLSPSNRYALEGRRDQQEGPLLPEELSHRYTFLNQHSRNQAP